MSAGLQLVALVPGNDDKQMLEGILGRPKSIECAVDIDRCRLIVHPRRDPGCYHEAQEILRPFLSAEHALVMFDHEGSGRELENAEVVRKKVLTRLEANGWSGRADVLVLEPELEVWCFARSPHVASTVGWGGDMDSLWDWLRARGHLGEQELKPLRPKEAFEALLLEANIPRSASLYGHLARTVSLRDCTDASFTRLGRVLRSWFPP